MKCFNLKLSAVNQHKVNWRFTADTCSWNNILCSFLFGVISTFFSSCLSCSQLHAVRRRTGFFETVLCLRSQADNNSSIKLCLCFKRDTIYGIDVGTVRFCKTTNMQQLLLSVSIGNLFIVTLLCFHSGWVKVRKTIVRKISSLWVKIPVFVATNSWKLSQHVL